MAVLIFDQRKHYDISGVATKSGDISQTLLENKIVEKIFFKVITCCHGIAVSDSTFLTKIISFLVFFSKF